MATLGLLLLCCLFGGRVLAQDNSVPLFSILPIQVKNQQALLSLVSSTNCAYSLQRATEIAVTHNGVCAIR
jgi:hypothetical protein